MKTDIHPDYDVVTVTCSCGNSFETRSTSRDLHVELCSECHPFYTGKQKLVDTGGRIDRFERRYGRRKKAGGASAETGPVEGPAAPDPEVIERLEEVEAEQEAAEEAKAAEAEADDTAGETADESADS